MIRFAIAVLFFFFFFNLDDCVWMKQAINKRNGTGGASRALY